MNVLVLTRTGNALMRGRGEFRVKLPKEKQPAAAKQYAALAEDVDEKLFDALRDVRTRLAARAGVPPYVIFPTQRSLIWLQNSRQASSICCPSAA